MNYSIIEFSGKQYKVKPNQVITVDLQSAQPGDLIELDKVLLQVISGKANIGTPYLPDTSIKAQVIEHTKGPKIRVATYKAKSRYRRVKGHRSHLTNLKILQSPPKKNAKTSKSPASKAKLAKK